MATETRATTTTVSPEVDVVSDINIQRIDGQVYVTFQPAAKVMEADGVTQATSPLGEPVHVRADPPPYAFIVNLETPEGVNRIKTMEYGALERIITAADPLVGTPAEVTSQLLQNGQGVQWAMTQEVEALRAAMLTRWDELIVAGPSPDGEPFTPLVTVEQEFGVRVDQGPNGVDGPFVL